MAFRLSAITGHFNPVSNCNIPRLVKQIQTRMYTDGIAALVSVDSLSRQVMKNLLSHRHPNGRYINIYHNARDTCVR